MYQYVPRISIPGIEKHGRKRYLTDIEVSELLDGDVVVEEKLDGRLIQLDIDNPPYICYGEYMKYVHSIYYDSLPLSPIPYTIGIDILDEESGRYLPTRDRDEIWEIYGIPSPPILIHDSVTVDDILMLLGTISRFSTSRIEGVVIKNYGRKLFGKVVDPIFDNSIGENYLRYL